MAGALAWWPFGSSSFLALIAIPTSDLWSPPLLFGPPSLIAVLMKSATPATVYPGFSVFYFSEALRVWFLLWLCSIFYLIFVVALLFRLLLIFVFAFAVFADVTEPALLLIRACVKRGENHLSAYLGATGLSSKSTAPASWHPHLIRPDGRPTYFREI